MKVKVYYDEPKTAIIEVDDKFNQLVTEDNDEIMDELCHEVEYQLAGIDFGDVYGIFTADESEEVIYEK